MAVGKWSYYNDNDPGVCAWIRELIKAGLVPDGEADERSITEVQPEDVRGFRQCHFFAGVLGWPEALRLAGWQDQPCWSGSAPCPSFSVAGKKKGYNDARDLWPEYFRLIAAVRPPILFGEQVTSALVIGHQSPRPVKSTVGGARIQTDEEARQYWYSRVCLDLESTHYTVAACNLPAACTGEIGEVGILRGGQVEWEPGVVGAPHIRQRLFWGAVLGLADTGLQCDERRGESGVVGDPCGNTESQTWEWERSGNADLNRGATGGVADSKLTQRRAECQLDADPYRRDGSGRGGNFSDSIPNGRLADSHGGISSYRDQQRSREHRQQSPDGRVGGVANTQCPERRTDIDAGGDRLPLVRFRQEDPSGPAGRSQTYGSWSDFELVACIDGKARRLESGSPALVAGTASRVVCGGDSGSQGDSAGQSRPQGSETPVRVAIDPQTSSEGRILRLRGYGNSIVPSVAAEFILAFEAAVGDLKERMDRAD